MTVREYIGARYVPLFMGDWDNTTTYEPLSIVLYQGNSYTSRQYVPTGIDITNEIYWAETGNYNAQVEAYRQEVLTFDGRITNNYNAISNVNERIGSGFTDENTIRKAIDDINTDLSAETLARQNSDNDINDKIGSGFTSVNTIRKAIDDINGEIAELTSNASIYSYFYGANAVIIGDSYAYGTGCSDHLSGDTRRWSSLLCSKLGATEFNYAVGSTGFCDPGSGGQNAPFKTQVLTAANSMSASERANTHLVVIAGGVNDYNEGATYGASQMQSGANQAAVNARNNFPNAIILVVPMLFKGHDANPRLWNFENAIINGVGGLSSVTRTVYIRGAWTWNWGMASHYISDLLHPNDLGHETIASQIYTHILGGSAYENRLETISWDEGFSAGVDAGGYFQFYNGVVQSMGISLVGSVAANATQKVGSVPPGCLPICNLSAPIMYSNQQAGIAIITSSGNIYLHTTMAIPNCYIAPFSYQPKGSL